jgi:capsular polysaccharide biosynthesis protein
MESEEELTLDLGRYLHVLLRWWYLILLGALLAGGAAWLVSAPKQPTYQAAAGIAIVRSSTQLTFDPRFVTTSGLNPYSYVDPVQRNKSLIAIVKNPEIANAVIAQLGNQLTPDEQKPTLLVSSISASSEGSDVIMIKAQASTPARAALLATTWAQEYVVRVNALYGESGLTVAELQAQANSAKQEYDGKEAALAAFLANSSIDQLTRQIAETQGILTAFQAAKQNARLAVFNQQTSAKVQTLSDLYAIQTKLDRLSADANALRAQSLGDNRTGSRGDELAALLLEVSAFSTWANLPVNLQIPLEQISPGSTPADQAKRLDTLIATLQDRRQTVQASIDTQARDLLIAFCNWIWYKWIVPHSLWSVVTGIQ